MQHTGSPRAAADVASTVAPVGVLAGRPASGTADGAKGEGSFPTFPSPDDVLEFASTTEGGGFASAGQGGSTSSIPPTVTMAVASEEDRAAVPPSAGWF
jgi:hypothetical protein